MPANLYAITPNFIHAGKMYMPSAVTPVGGPSDLLVEFDIATETWAVTRSEAGMCFSEGRAMFVDTYLDRVDV